MTKIAYLFPGQGAQSVGMGQDLCAHSPGALAVFDEADQALGFKISALCFYGPEESLRETVNTQPALFVTSIAARRALQEAGGAEPQATAGHSVGEYAALVAAGALDFSTGLSLVYRRAQLMHQAGQSQQGAMAAVLGLSSSDVAAACREAEQGGAGIVDVANFNGGGQVVISGSPKAVIAASEIAKAKGAKRTIPLNVSGAFHSRLMTPAAEAMRVVLSDASIQEAILPIVANRTADYETTAQEIRENLSSQIDHSVRWEETIQRLVADGFDTFVEVGAGTVLTGLMKRLAPGAALYSVGDHAGIAALIEGLR